MECKECREKLFAYAEEALKKEASKESSNESSMPGRAGLSQELQEHVSECTSCAALHQALSLGTTEGALHSEVPDGVTETVLRNVMSRISTESNVIEGRFGGNGWKNKNQERKKERWEKPRSIAALAAAAVLLVTLSVTFTLAVTERRLPRGVETMVQAPSEEQTATKDQVSAEAQDVQNSQEVITVHLTLEAPEAESVAVVGDWNGWDPEKNRMSDPNKDGIWELRLKLERGGEYRYQFLINGNRWIPDPGAPLKVKDGFGGTNSVLDI